MAAGGDDLAAAIVMDRRKLDLPVRAVEPLHPSQPELKVVPARLKQIVQLVVVEVHAAGRDLVQQRLPQVRARLVDQRDQCLLAFAELVAQARGELEAAGASADDDDSVQPGRSGISHGSIVDTGVLSLN